MPRARQFARLLAGPLRAALVDTPAVLIHGPRQSGKTTLARAVGERRGYGYVTFDDDAARAAAQADPIGFTARLPAKVVLDEVQRVPGLFTSLKAAIDERRTPGRFVLTGSGNVLLTPALADSLAGRMGILRLHPLSQCEIESARPRFLDDLLHARFRTGLSTPLGHDLVRRIVDGGYPAAIARREPARRRAWHRDYLATLIERDVRDMSRVRSLDTLPKLLRIAAVHTGRLINVADLAAPFELSRPTIHEHVAVLERVFLCERLPPWHVNEMSRLVKRPKLHMGDTGLACALLGLDAARLEADRNVLGQLLETFVLQELRRLASVRPDPVDFFHFRDRDDFEVDIVLEGDGVVAGVEVKAASTVHDSDLRGLRKLRGAAGGRFVAGVVLYDGSATINFGDALFAVPIRTLWEEP